MAVIHPNFDPVAFHIGSLGVHWYGISYMVSFYLALWLLKRRAPRYGHHPDLATELLFYGMLGVMLGGRIGYMILYQLDGLLQNPASLFAIQQGGMSFHGGFLGVCIAMWLFAKKHKMAPFAILDFIAPAVPIGLGLGRLGNFVNGELVGRVSDSTLPWLMYYPQSAHADYNLILQNNALLPLAKPVGDYMLLPRHPSQIYQAITEGLILFIVLWTYSQKPRPRMAVSALFLLGYGISRFCTEFFRQPDIGYTLFFGIFSKGQVYSLPMIIIGLIMFIMAHKKGHIDERI